MFWKNVSQFFECKKYDLNWILIYKIKVLIIRDPSFFPTKNVQINSDTSNVFYINVLNTCVNCEQNLIDLFQTILKFNITLKFCIWTCMYLFVLCTSNVNQYLHFFTSRKTPINKF